MAQSSFGFGDIIKWGLLLGGGYLVYEYFFAGAATATAVAPAAGTTSTGTAATTTTSAAAVVPVPGCPTSTCPPTTDPVATQKTKILAAAGSAGQLAQTASFWNFFFNQAYGLPSSTTWLLGDDGSPMTLDAYLALRQTKGFSGYYGGVSGFRGFGAPAARIMRSPRGNYMPAGVPMVANPMNYVRRF